jgi:hypothetical protein
MSCRYLIDGAKLLLFPKTLPGYGFSLCNSAFQAISQQELVTPQIGNNGANWEDLTAFTAITEGGTFPYNESQKISTVGESMRFKIALDLSAGNKPMLVVGTIAITAVGRSEE